MSKVGRNEPCPCGSGKKYKVCCREKNELERRPPPLSTAEVPDRAKPKVSFTTTMDDVADNLDVASNRVIDLVEAGQLDAAEHAARELLARYPDVHDGHDRLGMVFEARGDAKQAAHHYRQVVAFIEQRPDQYDVGFADHFRRLADKLDPLP